MNMAANLARGVSASGLNVVLPIVLLVILSHEQFSAWALLFSLAAVVSYFDLGIPVTIQAIAGRATAARVRTLRSAANSGLLLTGTLVGLSLLLALAVSASLGRLFPELPADQIAVASWALPILVAGQCANLLSNTISAVFTGIHESHVPAWAIVPARAVALALAAAAGFSGGSLALIAAGFSLPLILGVLFLYVVLLRRTRSEVEGAYERVSMRVLISQSGTLVVWNLAMLVVSGTGTIIVARVDFRAVPLYSFALVFVAALTGLEAAFATPLLSELGRLWANGDIGAFQSFLKKAVRLNSAVLFTVSAGGMLLGVLVMPTLLKGSTGLSGSAVFVLIALLLGSAVRQSFTPYSFALIGSSRHVRVIAAPLIEAAASLLGSVVLGVMFGVRGVALGFAVGCFVGVLAFLLKGFRQSGLNPDSTIQTIKHSIALPLLILVPAIVCAVIVSNLTQGVVVRTLVALFGLLLSASVAWRIGLRGLMDRRRGKL